MKKQWNKDIHDRLKDFPKKAPEGLLNDIQSEMLRRGLSVAPIANKRPAIILRIASVAAMILLLLGISYLFHWLFICLPFDVYTFESSLPACF